MGKKDPFMNGVWVVEDWSHDGLSIRRRPDGRLSVSAWAENWGDTWRWEAEISRGELEGVLANPDSAMELLFKPRRWSVETPESVPRGPYVKDGVLGSYDGFDGGTGGKS